MNTENKVELIISDNIEMNSSKSKSSWKFLEHGVDFSVVRLLTQRGQRGAEKQD